MIGREVIPSGIWFTIVLNGIGNPPDHLYPKQYKLCFSINVGSARPNMIDSIGDKIRCFPVNLYYCREAWCDRIIFIAPFMSIWKSWDDLRPGSQWMQDQRSVSRSIVNDHNECSVCSRILKIYSVGESGIHQSIDDPRILPQGKTCLSFGSTEQDVTVPNESTYTCCNTLNVTSKTLSVVQYTRRYHLQEDYYTLPKRRTDLR